MTADSQIIEGLDIEEYHAMSPVSKSGLDLVDLSPAIFHARVLNPNRPPRGTKPGQLEGSMAHCAVLEPDEFDKRYVVGPSVNRNTKVWKEFVETLEEGQTAIQAEQANIAYAQAASVRALPEIGPLFDNGKAEVSAFWRDPDTGVDCRCRPDFVHDFGDDSVLIIDLKTFTDPSPKEFARQCGRKFYAKQAAYYSDGYAAASGKVVRAFIFAAVGNEHPYAAAAMMLDEESLEAGRQHYKRNLRTYAECLRTNTWPGFSTGISVIRLPQWALSEVDA